MNKEPIGFDLLLLINCHKELGGCDRVGLMYLDTVLRKHFCSSAVEFEDVDLNKSYHLILKKDLVSDGFKYFSYLNGYCLYSHIRFSPTIKGVVYQERGGGNRSNEVLLKLNDYAETWWIVPRATSKWERDAHLVEALKNCNPRQKSL